MKKVLIIDDDADLRETLMLILEGKYELREASSRAEGMKKLKEFLPDLVLLDVMMERHDSGFEMSREIKNDPQLQHTKILMLTNVDKELKMDFKKIAGDPDWLPVDDYMVKLIEPNQLLSKIEKLIG